MRDNPNIIKILIPDPYIPEVNSDNKDFLELPVQK